MSINTYSVATKQCNGDKKYLLSGNIAPHQWYKRFCDEDGNPDLVSITNLADVLAWYRNGTSDQFGYNSPRFVGDSLCVSYDYFEDKFGFRKDRVRRSFVRLEEQGVLKRTVKNIELAQGTRVNRIFITLDIDFFNSCFSDPALDIRVKRDLPANNLHINSSTLTPCISNSIGSLHQCNHHISNKNKIKKDRSMIYASSEAQSGSSFLEKNLLLEEKEKNDFNGFLEISTSSIDKNNNALAQILSNTKVNLNPDNQLSSQVKNPSIDKKPRKLKDFYPLNFTDCRELQSLSKREFSLNAMNEILLDMSKRLTHPIFYSKKGFISYMANAFRNEMRDAVKISNESFKIKANLSSEESREQEAEKYLTDLENSREVSPEMHLKKKLGSVLQKTKAVELLKSYRSLAIRDGLAKMKLYKSVDLSPPELEIVLNQIKATHERFEKGVFIPIQKLELIIMETKVKKPNTSESKQIPDTLWGKIRRHLIGFFGEDGEAIDISWFSKLESTENEQTKEINLKAPTEFFKDWIERDYGQKIEQAAQLMGIKIKGFEC